MTTGEWISEAIEHSNAGGSQADDAPVRLRFLRAGQRVVDVAHGFRNLKRRIANGTATITNGNTSGSTPTNFGGVSAHFAVYLNGQRHEVEYLDEGEFFDLQERGSASASATPQYYTFRGQSSLGVPLIHIYPAASGSVVLSLQNYRPLPPTLVDRPGAAVATAGAAGDPNGAYQYRLTYVHPDGETEGGVIFTVTVTNKQIGLTEIPTSSVRTVTARKIYRTAAGGTTFKLVATIADNLTTTYTDNVADAALGATCPTVFTAVTGLEQMPTAYHRTALFDALLTRTARAEGDGRTAEFSAVTLNEFAQMWAEESMHHVNRRAPAHGSARLRG